MSDTTICILGCGRTAESVASFLRQKQVPFAVATESQPSDTTKHFWHNSYGIDIQVAPLTQAKLHHFEQLIVSPGIPPHKIDASLHSKIITDIDLFNQYCNKPVIAITGTNGKSSVVSLVGHILSECGYRVAVGGNLDIAYQPTWAKPALDLLQQNADIYILELSSFQLGYTKKIATTVSAIINIEQDHLDYHRDFQQYKNAKQAIYNHCQVAVFPQSEPCCHPTQPLSQSISFGSSDGLPNQWTINNNDISNNNHRLHIATLPNCLQLIPINVCAALAIIEPLRIDIDKVFKAIGQFKGLPHRAQMVDSPKSGVVCIDDSKATNIAATNTLLSTFSQPIILLLGGLGKNQDFSKLLQLCKQHCRLIIAFGRDGQLIADALKNKVKVLLVNTLKQATIKALKAANRGDYVVLSPACASFDQFQSYIERGQHFQQVLNDY